MADIKKVVPPADYSAQDFLSADYQTTDQEQIIITETVNYVKVTHNVKQITENVGITEQVSKLSSLIRIASTEEIAITESVLAVLSKTITKAAPTDTINITEQVSYVKGVAPPMSSGMLLSAEQRRHYPSPRKYYARPQVIEEQQQEVPLLKSKVTSSRKFVYSIQGAQIFQEAEAIRNALEQIKQQHEKQSTKKESNQVTQELVKPIVTKAEVPFRKNAVTTAQQVRTWGEQSSEKSSSTEQKLKVRSAIKMRYDVKDGIAYQKLIKTARLVLVLDTIEILDSIDI